VEDNAEVAKVLLQRVAHDVVMEERYRAPLWGVGLWRDYIEGVNCGFGCREKWGVDKRHLDLDPVHPNHLEAGRNSAIIIAIQNACGLGMGNSCKDECQGGDGHYGDADTGSIFGMGHFPASPFLD